ncbi:MAG: asparaginase [Thermoleophilia bacterium]|nr:asparaginase [Thermoleophilia bacterium]
MEPPLSVVVERGGAVEARHRVHAVAVRDGQVVESRGDPDLVTHMRSAAKPLQALPLALEERDLPDEELAIASASHVATPEQLAAVRALLGRSRSTEADLECGEKQGSKLAHNCSGKHAGMLLRAKRHAWPLPGYRLPGHPVQREILELVAAASGIPGAELGLATDGCGVVTFAVPIRALALAFARMASGELPGAGRVLAAMRARPDLIGGPGKSDTSLMAALPGAVAKRGAEGVLCLALPDGTGFAFKVEDGGDRAALSAAAAVLGVDEIREQPLRNSRGETVGRISPS